MKAILVVDMPNDMNVEETKALNVTLFNGLFVKELKTDCPLKPMPTRKLALFDPNHCDMEEEIKIIQEINGYNRCIDEILGGK